MRILSDEVLPSQTAHMPHSTLTQTLHCESSSGVVCAQSITVELDEHLRILSLQLHGAPKPCEDILRGLLESRSVQMAYEIGIGRRCGSREGSCADEIARALKNHFPQIRPTYAERRALFRQQYPQNGAKWGDAQLEELGRLHSEGYTLEEISHAMGRTQGAIATRLVRMGLLAPAEAWSAGFTLYGLSSADTDESPATMPHKQP